MPREFESLEEFKVWVRTWCARQSREFNCTLAARSAALALPNISGDRPERLTGFSFDLILLRATLISLVVGVYGTNDVRLSARSAANAASSAFGTSTSAAAANAANAAVNAVNAASADSSAAANAAFAAANAINAASSGSGGIHVSGATCVAIANLIDTLDSLGISGSSDCPLWADLLKTEELIQNWADLRSEWQSDPSMAFWIDWYDGLLEGRAPDWKLWHDIACIDDGVWQAGPDDVAKAIDSLKKDLHDPRRADGEAAQEFEPDKAVPFFDNSYLVQTTSLALSTQIGSAIDSYLNESGRNCLPPEFEPLVGIAHASFEVSQLVSVPNPGDEDAKKLREEIGNLKARVIELERELSKARASQTKIFAPEFKRAIAKSIGDWKLYAAIIGSVWLVSGDDLGMQKRLENLGKARDALFADFDEEPKQEVVPPLSSTSSLPRHPSAHPPPATNSAIASNRRLRHFNRIFTKSVDPAAVKTSKRRGHVLALREAET